jgi:hypothetical protein
MKAILLANATAAPTTGVGVKHPQNSTYSRTFQAVVDGTGAVTATVVIQVSNDGTNYLTLGTITLSGITTSTDGFASSAAWEHVRASLSAISGTSATVNVTMGF